ncbi:MAG: hypothetical protein EAY75_15165 [Bacteroidetes bacterium]|nr:MAG: hypothetical protein EAY75_15165 [Bacteroidota bacterium]
MKQLSKLSPAETLLVLQDKKASLRELLKVTFLDLLLKQVVRTFDLVQQPTVRNKDSGYKYVEIGKNFWTYQPLPHENIFLTPFQKSPSLQVLFRNMVKTGYQNAKSKGKFTSLLLQSPSMDTCFSRSILQSLFGGFSITLEGQELRNIVSAEILELENQLPSLILNEPEKAQDIMYAIKGNIFLVDNIEFDLLKQKIDNELLAEFNKRDDTNNGGGCSGFAWYGFDDYSDSFDSSCGSGDSGCAGGGCGGGGCGGGGCGGGD